MAATKKTKKPQQKKVNAKKVGAKKTAAKSTARRKGSRGGDIARKTAGILDRLGERADDLSAKFNVQVKEGVKKVEGLTDEWVKNVGGIDPHELASKFESGFDRWSKEAAKVTEEASVEIKKMYEQARTKLQVLLKKS